MGPAGSVGSASLTGSVSSVSSVGSVGSTDSVGSVNWDPFSASHAFLSAYLSLIHCCRYISFSAFHAYLSAFLLSFSSFLSSFYCSL